MRVALPIDKHPKRDEIIRKLLDKNISARQISEEYEINRNTVNKARHRLLDSAGEIVAASIPISPQIASQTVDADLSIPALANDLDFLKNKLRTIQTNPGLKPSQIMQAIEGERRVVDSLIRMADMVRSHNDGKNTPAYQQLQKAIADTIRAHPEIRDTFRQAMERAAPTDTEAHIIQDAD